ncbi:hypothetical protein [Psychrobacter sp.]|uniref:hypothetical protein n=1 Tax=Psychrobacter sp. TaxID=56811 RepID=UPI0025FE10F4|nr:hypothetical protein [Psychrobacter sp.]
MGQVNDRYKSQIEHSVLLNGDPLDNHKLVGDRIIIKPQSYSRPTISEDEKDIILKELAEDLKHYGLTVIHLDEKLIKVEAGDFELIVPKSLVVPYDDAIFASILKQQQDHYSRKAGR